ncbi:MAG: 50S ribosomal protein L11 methyltransferase [Clostridiales bacterium]|jgi:ribosomal protein L11 methyltransferase|nr:50S ribosomal protein L11 methyltransferase [Clostridiales bacterium]
MEWTKYTIITTDEAADAVSSMLLDYGVEAIELEDAYMPSEEDIAEMFLDIAPETLPDMSKLPEAGESHISFYLRLPSEDENPQIKNHINSDTVDDSYTIHDKVWSAEEIMLLISRVQNGLTEMSKYLDVGAGTITSETSKEEDWRDNWKNYYKPIAVGDILIKPVWEEIPEELQVKTACGEVKVIDMEPGAAFGTGSHETTRLCTEQVSKYVSEGDSVLDIGTGSGVLGLAALKKGASLCVATEIDPGCAHIINENCFLNNIDDNSFKLYVGNLIDDEEVIEKVRSANDHNPYDLVVSNILAPIILLLAREDQVDSFIKKGGYYITSGIINTRKDDVVEAFSKNPNWEYVETVSLGEWVCVIAKRI